jgi:hypothetical protein
VKEINLPLNELDQQIADKFLSLDEQGKKDYLDDNLLVIIDETPTEDGVVISTIEISTTLEKFITDNMKQDETFSQAISRIVSDALTRTIKYHNA